jgi:hypothetical protein
VKVHSLGYRTDLIFARFDGRIIDRGDFLVVKTPTSPSFYWGNFLLFTYPPGRGDDVRWRQLFAREIGAPPAYQHQTFGWESQEGTGVVQPFLDAGFHLNQNVVMAASTPQWPSKVADFVTIRPLEAEAEWSQAIDNQVVCREAGHEESSYRLYCERQMTRYRKMA